MILNKLFLSVSFHLLRGNGNLGIGSLAVGNPDGERVGGKDQGVSVLGLGAKSVPKNPKKEIPINVGKISCPPNLF